MISCASIVVSTACRNASTSNAPSGPINFIRFSDARLQAESSRNMYSEHGFDALMRAVFLHGCQRLMVVSTYQYGDPGMQLDSTIKRWQPFKNMARITASHPCSDNMFLYHCPRNHVSR